MDHCSIFLFFIFFVPVGSPKKSNSFVQWLNYSDIIYFGIQNQIKKDMIRVHKDVCHIITCVTISVGVFVLMVCLLAMYTLQPVLQNEFAVEYNTYTCSFDDILEEGKYSVRVGTELIKFQRTLQDLTLGDLVCLTNDKVEVTLQINMQVQYHEESLIPIILKEFGNNGDYRELLSSLATSSILNTCLQFEAEDYYSKRAEIDAAMSSDLEKVINITTVGTDFEFLQLQDISFPPEYSALILEKQTTEQLERTLINDRQNQLTIANTNLFVANNTANIKYIQANQQASTILNEAYTTEQVVIAFWSNRAEVYESVMNNIGFNASELVEYIKSESMRKSSKLVASIDF